jgi:hypothetical protein
MAVPSRNLRDFLLTHWAESVLLFPEVDKPTFSFQGIYDVNVQTFFVVGFPFWVIWVSLRFDFDVSLNWHVSGLREAIFLTFHLSVKDPIVPLDGLEVFLRDPFVGFLWVSSFHPPSESLIDRVVYGSEDFCAHHMLVILCPSSNDWIQYQNEFPGR